MVELTTKIPRNEHATWTGKSIDLSRCPRLAVFSELAEQLGKAKSAEYILQTLDASMRRAFGPRTVVVLTVDGLEPGAFRVARIIDAEGRAEKMDPTVDGTRAPVLNGGFFTEIVTGANAKLFQDLELGGDPIASTYLKDVHAVEACPVYSAGKLDAWVLIGTTDPKGLTPQHVEQSVLRANLIFNSMGWLTKSAEVSAAHLKVQREVDKIASIQRALLPPSFPEIAGVEGAANYETFDRAGGDYYSLVPLKCVDGKPDPNGPWGVIMADASGHGPAAAVLISMLHATFFARPLGGMSPGEVLNYLNTQLTRRPIEGSFVTAVYAVITPGKDELQFACAGHPPMLLKSPGAHGKVERLAIGGGIPLGVLDNVNYETSTATWKAGQSLVLYTDGIIEAQSPTQTMFGIIGIERACAECSGEPDCIVETVRHALRDFEAGQRPTDDQTLLVLRRTQ